jgi:hypothetical protein
MKNETTEPGPAPRASITAGPNLGCRSEIPGAERRAPGVVVNGRGVGRRAGKSKRRGRETSRQAASGAAPIA